MMTIFERVNTALAAIAPPTPFAMDTYLGALPDQYLVYSLIVSGPQQHADDVEKERTHRIQVSIYDRAGLVALPDVDTPMLAAGFIFSSQRQLPKDPDTGHYGLVKEYVFLEDL